MFSLRSTFVDVIIRQEEPNDHYDRIFSSYKPIEELVNDATLSNRKHTIGNEKMS